MARHRGLTGLLLGLLATSGCVGGGSGRGSQGGTGTGGTGQVQVLVGVDFHFDGSPAALEACRVALERLGVEYTRRGFLAEVKLGNQKTVETFLACGMSPDTVEEDAGPPLNIAAAKGHEAIVRVLLAHKAAVDGVKDEIHWSPLLWAASEGHAGVVALLLEAGADINGRSPRSARTALMEASLQDRLPVVELLLSKGADVNAVDSTGENALSLATRRYSPAVVKALLAAQARPEGERVLHSLRALIGNYCDSEVLGMLVKAGADPNGSPKDDPPVILALSNALKGDKHCIAPACVLIQAGADLKRKDKDGQTANKVLKKMRFSSAKSFTRKSCPAPAP